MNSSSSVSFTPRRSFRRIWIIMAGFGVFVPIGLVIYFVAGDKAGLPVAGFGLVPVLYMLYRVLSPGSAYVVGPEGVLLKNGGRKRQILLEDIRGAAVLSEDEARQVIRHYMAPGIDGERERDLKQWYRANKAYGYFTQYCTVPIVQETASRGHEINIVKFGTKVAGRFVILKLKSGEEFLLSPEDCDGFFVKLSSSTSLEDTNPESSYTFSVDPVRRRKRRDFLRWYRYAGAAAILIVLFVFLWQDLIQPALSGEEPVNPVAGMDEPVGKVDNAGVEYEKPSAETGWLDDDTYRYIVNVHINTYEEDPEARRQELIRTVAGGYRLNFIGQVIGWYCGENNIDPDDEQYDAMHTVLFDMISRHEPVVVSTTFGGDYTRMTAVLDIIEAGLRSSITAMLDEALEGLGR